MKNNKDKKRGYDFRDESNFESQSEYFGKHPTTNESDNKKKNYLIELITKTYPQGDSYFASRTAKGYNWKFGYSNDYPMQHGNGREFMLSDEVIEELIK